MRPGPDARASAFQRATGLGNAGVVVVDRSCAGRIVPVQSKSAGVLRRAFELAHGDAGPIASERRRVVFQAAPGNK